MADAYVWWGDARVTPWMAYQLDRLNADLKRLFGVELRANSGIRLAQEQEAIWYARMTLTPNGRRVYETRWWNGRLWYRISSAGTVAPPRQSNHEIQGDDAAVDIADTGSDPGITARNSVRGRWIREHAAEYGLEPEGDGFGEGWHFKARGIFRTPPAGGNYNPYEEDDMADPVAIKAAVASALYDTRDGEGRNLFDSGIQTRRELRDRAAEAIVVAKGSDGRNVLDGVIQARADIAELTKLVKAGGLNPADVAKTLVELGIGAAVADELGKRLSKR